MNGQTIPSTGEPDVIVTDGENIRYGEKKKLSLTLPLLNVVVTNAVNEEEPVDIGADVSGNANQTANNGVDSVKLDVSSGESSKMKKIYESDDTFIQTIFSQTIKSTTATPTDDEPSQDFGDAFKQTSEKSSQDDTDAGDVVVTVDVDATSDKQNVPADDKSESISKEPAAIYTYFHQTIEVDDDSPDLDTDLDKDLDVDDVVTNNDKITIATCNPIHTTITTTTVSTHNTAQINICTEIKDEFSDEKDGGGASCDDNSLNNTSTAFASNEAISETEHSLTQLNSLESDVSARCFSLRFFLSLLPHFTFN